MFFNPPLAFYGLLPHVKEIVSLIFVSFFLFIGVSFVSFRFVSDLSCFVSVVSRFVW